MTTNEHDFSISRRAQLTTWIGGQMLRGAGYAAILVVGFGLVLTVIWLIGTLLPEESRQAPDPNTWSSLAVPGPQAIALA
ncbi:MAG: RC-LH1 core complex protein PufX [Rhodobacterales bacterium]|nr:RC-LH1 core complex protein PufX [Rhodobacterales bacterium]